MKTRRERENVAQLITQSKLFETEMLALVTTKETEPKPKHNKVALDFFLEDFVRLE
jgi:hypothetical protein